MVSIDNGEVLVPEHDTDLYGTAEIAALLGVSRQRVLVLAKHPDFPAPLAVLSMGKIWCAADIRTWAKQHRPPAR